MSMNRFHLPFLGFGAGLRPQHYLDILATRPQEVEWFEVISENFMDTEGKPRVMLERVKEHYPIVMHGVTLSIGSTDPLNPDYLAKLKALADWLNPAWVSDHLCWSGVNHKMAHDLLPVPYTEEALAHIVPRIQQVQDVLGRPLILENPSTYLEFASSQMPEWEFIARMAEESGCGLLLDVNNVYVSCYNHGWNAKTYLDAIPADRVVQIHLAGHENRGTHIVDTHEGQVIDPVWNLYRYAAHRLGQVSTMIEWDEGIPELPVLLAEVQKAREAAQQPLTHVEGIIRPRKGAPPAGINHPPFAPLIARMQEGIFSGDIPAAEPSRWIRPKEDFPEAAQLKVYVDGYRFRLFDVVSEDYPALRRWLGDERMNRLVDAYIEATPPEHFNLARYCYGLADYAGVALADDGMARALAELEKAVATVFHLPESPALTPDMMEGLAPEDVLTLKIQPRASCLLLEQPYPANDFADAVHRKQDLPSGAPKSTFVAVYRHQDMIMRLGLEPGEYTLLKIFQQGATVEEAFTHLATLPEDDQTHLAANLQTWFGKWVGNGVLAAQP